MRSFFNKLLYLPKTEIIDYKIENNKVYLIVQSTFDEVPCRKCGGSTKSKSFAKEREIRHLPMNEQECYLAHLERTCKKRNLDFKLENHGLLYYSYSVRL